MRDKTQRITISAILVAFSLALFSLELLIPPFPFAPSAKIGLANIVTLFMLANRKFFRIFDCFMVLVCRCLLAALITGRLMSVTFSLVGGITAVLVMLFISNFFNNKIILVSVFGSIFHNLAQMLVAICFYGTFSAVYYLPALLITGVLSGVLTGFCVVLVNKNIITDIFRKL